MSLLKKTKIKVKEIQVDPIDSKSANEFIRRYHYSKKVVPNSVLHFGCFFQERLIGVLSFGPSFDKRKIITLVEGTGWNEFVELNRMAFKDEAPKNTESRCLAICIRLIKKFCPHIKWIVSFADATMCGDGTSYRAAGFLLTGIKKNRSMIKLPNGKTAASMTYTKGKHLLSQNGKAAIPEGSQYLPGFQLRYIYLIDKAAKLTCEVLPFKKIDELGAGMYKGNRISLEERKRV